MPNELVIVRGGGHEFDNPGEQPNEAGITEAIADFSYGRRNSTSPSALLRRPEDSLTEAAAGAAGDTADTAVAGNG